MFHCKRIYSTYLVAKSHTIGGLNYSTFTKLYLNCVCIVMDYAAGIWENKCYNPPDIVHRKIMRHFLGSNGLVSAIYSPPSGGCQIIYQTFSNVETD